MSRIPRVDASLVLKPIPQSEIESLITNLPNKSSYGTDGISNILLKSLSTSISFPLCALFNQSIIEGKFPEAMKIAEIIPLYKGKEFDLVVNYRPVSLLMTMSKVLEKAVYSRVYSFLERNKILYDSQYGFRTKRSCEQAILELTGRILQAKNKGMHSAALFLDLSKAFDTLDHQILLKKLELYGLRGVCNDWFSDYLKDRKLLCRLNSPNNEVTRSKTYGITYGTAQGSCLGPLLFILFCNDVHLLPTYSNIILFADDTTLSYSHDSLRFLKYALEHDMVLLSDWYKANKLSLNVHKTVLIKFWPKNKEFTIDIDGVKVTNSAVTKFLGVWVDENMTWKEHVNTIYNKMNSNRLLLQKAKNLLDSKTLRSIYHAHIGSHINYCLVVWGSMISAEQKNMLLKAQKSCVRILECKKSNDTILEIYSRQGILTLPDMICLELSKLGYKIRHNLIPVPIQSIFKKGGGEKLHRYPTRHKNLPNIQKHTDHIFHNSFLVGSIREYMKATNNVKDRKTVRGFTKMLKCNMISTYKS